MANRLDLSGLTYLWSKIKTKFATKDTATTSANGLMSSTDKAKLDGIAAGAQVNSVTSVNNQTGAVSITPANIGAQTDVGLYIDAQGYLCQKIGSDT